MTGRPVFDVWLGPNGILRSRFLRTLALTIYYLGVLVGLLVMYGKGHFTAPSYIYQGF